MSHCPICGKNEGYYSGHKCDPKKLAAIDRAMKQERKTRPEPSFRERLRVGFLMLNLSEE